MNNSFQQAHIVGSQYGKVRRLSGFRKGHRVPEDHHDAAQEFIRKIGQEEVSQLAETIHAGLRTTFHYKRKQLEYVCESGIAAIKTPDFEVNITIQQDPHDAANYSLASEITHFQSYDTVFDAGFCTLFNPYCDRLVIGFEKAIDLENKIDAIEEKESLEPYLDYEPDCSSFTLKIPQPNIQFKFTPHELEVTLPNDRNLQRLVKHCAAAFEALAKAGVNVIE